jgi:hypothetical protein
VKYGNIDRSEVLGVKYGNIDRSEVLGVSGFQFGPFPAPNALEFLIFLVVIAKGSLVFSVEEIVVLFEFRNDAVLLKLVVRVDEELVDHEHDCDGKEVAKVVNFFSYLLVVSGEVQPEDRGEVFEHLLGTQATGSFHDFLLAEVLVTEAVVLFPYLACHLDQRRADVLWEILLDHQ